MSCVVQHAPKFTESDAVQIAKDLFEINVSARQLPSERDQNFKLTDSGSRKYVLKLANATEHREMLDFQNQAMMHIGRKRALFDRPEAAVPSVVPTVKGEQIASVHDQAGTAHLVRLLTYLPGKPLALARPHDAHLLTGLGRFFGNIDRTLQDFDHPAAHHDFHWDLKHAGRVISGYIDLIENPADRDLVRRFLDRYQAHIAPHLPDLRCTVIHSDANDYNILVGAVGDWRQEVTGVIDFGDMVFTQTVNEVAIACAYAMMGKADPLATAKAIVGGYHHVYPLTELELAVLFDLICMRLCMSVCNCAHQSKQEPENEYLRISEKPAWALLHKLAAWHARFAEYTFRHGCGLPAVPQQKRILAWLQREQQHFAPIVDDDLHADNQLVLDLSVGSLMLGLDGAGTDLAAVTRSIFDSMATAGVDVGIGRYNEARLLYTTEQFRTQTDEMPEHRTVHLGIDLYKRSGDSVYAPLDGKIHSFANNSIPLDYGPTIILEHQTGDGDRFYTLYGHLSPDSLIGLEIGMPIPKGRPIARLGEPAVNGSWPPHVHFQIVLDLLGETGTFPGVARPSERDVWTSICPDPNLILGIPPSCFPTGGRSVDEILGLRHRSLGRNLSIAYERPLKIVHGRGQHLYDEDGRAYLDGVNNVCHVGHCHPQVVAAGQRQMAVLNTNTRYLHDNIIDYAQRLLAKLPEPLNVCYFVCSGSEANELALRLARTYTGRQDIIMVDGGYHGNTQALIDVSPYKHDRRGGRGAPAWAHKVVMPDGYRGPHKGAGAETGARYAAYVKQAAEQIQSVADGPAAFICESMLGCGGQIVLPADYLAEAFRHVRAAGGVCIVDEVQVGFGRVGSHFWAFETQNVVPDIITLGKPMGNGHPLAAVITTAEIAEAFANGMEYFNTFGGNPVSCAIGMAVLDVIENEGLQQNAARAGRRLLEGLRGLQAKYAIIGDVRGLGLYAGIELVTSRETLEPAAQHADYVINRLRQYGILISIDGPLDNVLKLKPPLVFSEQNAAEVVAALDKVLGEDCLRV